MHKKLIRQSHGQSNEYHFQFFLSAEKLCREGLSCHIHLMLNTHILHSRTFANRRLRLAPCPLCQCVTVSVYCRRHLQHNWINNNSEICWSHRCAENLHIRQLDVRRGMKLQQVVDHVTACVEFSSDTCFLRTCGPLHLGRHLHLNRRRLLLNRQLRSVSQPRI